MRLVCISDTHSMHKQMTLIPDGDVLIHAGDSLGSGSLPQLDEFVRWMGALPHAHKILIAGNHDFCFSQYPVWSREMAEKAGLAYLEAQEHIIDGVKFWGAPYTPFFRNMAFNVQREDMAEKWASIPDDTHVLITHGPPYNIFDAVPVGDAHIEKVGCEALLRRLESLPHLKAHVFGHIHESHGFARREQDGIKFANAAICNGRFRPMNTPIIIDL